MADTFGAIVALSITGAACLGSGWWCIDNLKKARYLLDTPTSKIRSAAQGYVELYGVLKEGVGPMFAPLSGQTCVWWSFSVDQQVQNERKQQSWKTVEKGSSGALLCLSDGTGDCLIDPQGAHILPMTKKVWYGTARHPLKNQMHAHFLQTLLVGAKRYRYTEQRLHAHEPLYAIGDFVTRGGGREAFDLSASQGALIREWKGDFVGLVRRFDQDGNGELDQQEWQAVRDSAKQQAQRIQQAQQIEPAQHYLRKPQENRPFVLSSYGEDAIAKRLRWQALLAGLVCVGSALAFVYILNILF